MFDLIETDDEPTLRAQLAKMAIPARAIELKRTNSANLTPLLLAAESASHSIVLLLVDQTTTACGCTLAAACSASGKTALHSAAAKGRDALCTELLAEAFRREGTAGFWSLLTARDGQSHRAVDIAPAGQVKSNLSLLTQVCESSEEVRDLATVNILSSDL